MTTEDKSIALMGWLEANPGEPPPANVEPEVIEAVYALRPDLAPKPAVDIAMILDKIEEGPFAENNSRESVREGDLVSLKIARKSRQTWGRVGLLAAAAMVLVVVVPLKDDEAVTRAPMFPGVEETEELGTQTDISPTQEAQESSTTIIDEDEFIREAIISTESSTEEVDIVGLLGVRGGQNSESQAGAYNDDALQLEAVGQVRTRSYTTKSETENQNNGEGGAIPPANSEPTSNDTVAERPELESASEFNEVDMFGTLGSADAEVSLGQGASDDASGSLGFRSRSSGGSVTVDSTFRSSGRRMPEASRAMPPPEVEAQALTSVEEDDETSQPTSYPSSTNLDFESVPIEEDIAATITNEEMTIVIEQIETLLEEGRFDEALRATRLNRPMGEEYPSLLKQLWLMEAQALTALGRTEEAEYAMTEANKL